MQREYQSGYRGVNDQGIAGQANGQANYNGRAYRLRHDRNGREFICVNGRAVYFEDQQGGQPQQHEAYKLNDERMNQQRPGQLDYQSPQYRGTAQGDSGLQGAPPAPPAPIRSDLNSAAPASPSLNADTGISAEQRTDLNESADVDAAANVDASANTSADSGSSTNASADVDADLDSAGDSNEQSSSDNDSSTN
jgi:hypothetical protein